MNEHSQIKGPRFYVQLPTHIALAVTGCIPSLQVDRSSQRQCKFYSVGPRLLHALGLRGDDARFTHPIQRTFTYRFNQPLSWLLNLPLILCYAEGL